MLTSEDDKKRINKIKKLYEKNLLEDNLLCC